MIKKLIIPCRVLKREYLIIDTLFILINEETWAIIEKPENEQRKLIKDNFIERLKEVALIKLHPFVISMQPKNIEYIESFGIFKIDSTR